MEKPKETIELGVFGAWLWEFPYPLKTKDLEELGREGKLPGMKLVHLLPGEWDNKHLPKLREQFSPWMPTVRDPSRYVIMLGRGRSLSVHPLKE